MTKEAKLASLKGMSIYDPLPDGSEEWLIKQLEEAWAREKILTEALEFYANKNNYVEEIFPETGAEVKRKLNASDTETYGFQKDPYSKNILQVIGGKRARQALAQIRGEE